MLVKSSFKITNNIEATYETMPMLIIQLINNNNRPYSFIALFSILFSVAMAFNNSIEVGYGMFRDILLPIYELQQTIEKEN